MTSPTLGPATASAPGAARLAIALFLGTAAYIFPFGAAAGVLLPARLAELDPTNKVALVAVLTGVAALAGLVGNLMFGALSDRTHSRWGARTPWLLAGAGAAALLMLPLARATTVVGVMLCWGLAVVALNAITMAVIATLPDRVPATRRATVAAAAGAGNLLGNGLGTVLGAAMLDQVGAGLLAVAAVVLALAVVTAVVGAEPSNTRPLPTAGAPRPSMPGPALGSQRPTAAEVGLRRRRRLTPDFSWAFAARLLLVLGYFMVHAFQLYLFTDYLGLDVAATANALTINAVLFSVAALLSTGVAGPLSDRIGRRKPLVLGAAALFTAAVLVPLASATTVAMAVFSTLGGLAFGVFYAADLALMSEVLPDATARGRDLGLLNVANVAGQTLGPATSSLIVGLGVGFAPVFLTAALVCALGTACFLPIRGVR